jgi:chromosomal replication initiator protein
MTDRAEWTGARAQQTWQACLGDLQLQMTRGTFDTWLKHTEVVSFEDGYFVIGVHSAYAVDWLENRLLGTIKRTLQRLMGRSVEIRFIVSRPSLDVPCIQEPLTLLSSAKAPAADAPVYRPNGNGPLFCQLNPRYTFDTFVVGPSNRLAHAASLAVAENPAAGYNPLFIYGGVGLGKTHLLNSLGRLVQERALSVLYVSAEHFTNDLINAIRNQHTEEFRTKYRQLDVLLVDDIQFIAGKERTQEEFFHTFNALYAAQKQVVISSDRPPKGIHPLEDRLLSRFEWGLIADVQPPDLETRMAILRSKAEQQKVQVPMVVMEYIARKIPSNIRELEGALTRVIAYAQLMRQPLTLELAQRTLDQLLVRPADLTPEQVIALVADHYGLSLSQLTGRNRTRPVARARQMAMYVIRQELGSSLPQIGKALGGRDHSTVKYACDKIPGLLEKDHDLHRDWLAIRKRLFKGNAPA